jgi:peptide/nickel transport system permease protein
LLALAAASISMAIGAAIPVEAICDVPGLGRLAWQAAVARDLPLLINLTMLIALVTTAAMAVSQRFNASESTDSR